ncbi:hypothetical protein IAD21_02759 [Abditibacteriota bacterium]|nr:hypothetical protein IAD21_02759 [Abditibacteriota bacterium]
MNARFDAPSTTSQWENPPLLQREGDRRARAQTASEEHSPDEPFRRTLSPEAEFVLIGARIRLEGELARRFDHLLQRGQPYPGERRRSATHQNAVPLNWALILFLCTQHRVTGLVARHLSKRGWRNVPPEIASGLNRYFGEMALHSAILSAELLHVSNHLQKAGVPMVSFKGPTLAIGLYGNGVVRPSADIDLLVPRAHVQRAHALLRELGYAHEVDLSPSQERQHLRVDSVFNLLRVSPPEAADLFPYGLAVELHWAITSPCLPFDFTYESVEKGLHPLEGRGELKGQPALSAHDLLLVLVVHGAKHLWERLLWLCDIAQLLERNPDLDWHAVLKSAHEREIERMMALCLSLVRDVMGVTLPRFVEEWLSTQPQALRLASRLRNALLSHELEEALLASGLEAMAAAQDDEDDPPPAGTNRLLAQTIDRPIKRLGFFWHVATTPSARERATVTLPPGLDGLWLVLQPLHALKKRLS